jgi:hypothetical protein
MKARAKEQKKLPEDTEHEKAVAKAKKVCALISVV